MASNSQGIQQLLQAEKSAADKVAEARKKKAKRLKQAKEEAQQEIDAYRKERENNFKEYEQGVMGSKDDMAISIDKDTQKQIAELNDRVKEHQQQALNDLLNVIYDIQPAVHINMR